MQNIFHLISQLIFLALTAFMAACTSGGLSNLNLNINPNPSPSPSPPTLPPLLVSAAQRNALPLGSSLDIAAWGDVLPYGVVVNGGGIMVPNPLASPSPMPSPSPAALERYTFTAPQVAGETTVKLVGQQSVATMQMITFEAATLDLSFNLTGQQTIPTGGNNSPVAGVAVLSDPILKGKVLFASILNGHTGLARFNENGTLDMAFGVNGVVNTIVGESSSPAAIVVQPDGKILIVGKTTTLGRSKMMLIRYASNGTLDAGFGAGGVNTLTLHQTLANDEARAVTLQADGKIIVAGFSTDLSKRPNPIPLFNANPPPQGPWRSPVLVRLTNTGTFDPTFGSTGVVNALPPALPAFDPFSAKWEDVKVDSQGKIIVGGRAYAANIVARYQSNGLIDPSFSVADGNGTVGFDLFVQQGSIRVEEDLAGPNGPTPALQSVTIQAADKIVVTTTEALDLTGPRGRSAFVARYDSLGNIDASFGNNGFLDSEYSIGGNFNDEGFQTVLQPDQKILVGGYTTNASGNRDSFVLRLTANGQRDSTFGVNGVMRLPFDAADNDEGRALAIDPSFSNAPRILFGGSLDEGGIISWTLSRIWQ